MTTVYFVRHAEPNYANHDDMTRELTPKGLADSKLVTRFLKDKNVDVVFSSPFKRAVDTIRDFAQTSGLPIHLEDGFRERRIGEGWMEDEDFTAFCERQWSDFDYKRPGGESLREVQARNVAALERLLSQYGGKTLVVGTHGVALSTIINHYDGGFGYAGFASIRGLMPWVVKMTFEGDALGEIQHMNPIEKP